MTALKVLQGWQLMLLNLVEAKAVCNYFKIRTKLELQSMEVAQLNGKELDNLSNLLCQEESPIERDSRRENVKSILKKQM